MSPGQQTCSCAQAFHCRPIFVIMSRLDLSATDGVAPSRCAKHARLIAGNVTCGNENGESTRMVKIPALAADELTRLLGAEFPQVWGHASGLSIEKVSWGGCRLRQAFREQSLRPG